MARGGYPVWLFGDHVVRQYTLLAHKKTHNMQLKAATLYRGISTLWATVHTTTEVFADPGSTGVSRQGLVQALLGRQAC